ncbi:Phosphatidylinositol 3- and 4-kinase family protein [Trichomonas vaginalis G3]|uniref:phosphatidylinositol 3-kinase n=1 Tax=Trichomonas vaginalis (strain ATCC PRA-98 / G3) TaxID=412133 RepID=A2E8G5_TRIV3|nr:Class III phosphoinositide 3-kinase catalytic domain-containing protein [Trichomonas vaginalis G3]EAY11093.1 Phosphatidylinositol 3- and 4-kinase family protein [Trichomonas vaginalis G3]KAI5520447.1 Class III phosphoinositide 3-kinase catalytic domain-containing protein [Trichomonas vaginalis G3]|eukprot:XP_001323316.1 Phosphatidylinositol 3- and 4-kinase family protein [Trichomonas vaginalis G3]
MQNANIGLSKTANYGTNVKIRLRSFTVNVDNQIRFNLFHYFQIQPPEAVIGYWDIKYTLPFICEAECMILSKDQPLTCPIILQSEQISYGRPKIPEGLTENSIMRKYFIFEWNKDIEFPIYYSELPSDSIVNFKFYARLFQTEPKFVGQTQLRLFTQTKTRRLRLGFFPLVFDETPPTKLSRHIRRLYTGKDKEYKCVDTQLKIINKLFHPSDAEIFYKSIIAPSKPPNLSKVSQYVHVFIESPSSNPSTLILHEGLMLPTSKSLNSLSPYQRLYYDLAHSSEGFKTSFIKDSKTSKILEKIKTYGPLSELQPIEVNTLYHNFMACIKDQALMPALFRSVNWDDKSETDEIEQILNERDPIDPEYALEFFTDRYNIKCVRQFAVKCIKNMKHEEILLYLPQILQATKVKYTEGLEDVLVNNALNDPIFASTLYWNAQVEKEQFSSLLEKMIKNLTGEVKQQLDDEIELFKKLYNLLQNHPKGSPAAIRDVIKDLLNNDPVHSQLKNFKPTRLPLDPSKFVVGIDENDVKVFKSKLCPVCLNFKLENGGNYRVIFKLGDDMRQDQLILQLFEVMDHIFKAASMQLNITAYKTLAFSETFGCCQFIDNSKAILDIAKDGMSISQFLANSEGMVEAQKIRVFTESLAAYSVMTYVLKIGDRHDNNILVTKDGRLLHIDYGFILGDVTKPFTPPLKLSKEMIETIGTNGMQKLCDWACPAFNSLRKKSRLILVLIELMFTAPLECFQNNPKRRLQQVENCLLLKCTEIEASLSLQATFTQSLNSKMQVFWDAVHTVAVSTNASAEK